MHLVFFFQKKKIRKVNYNLTINDKIRILYDIFINNYDKIYILSPKSFYFWLPFFFRKTQFYAIVYEGKKRNRPINYLRKYLYKFRLISRKKINKYSYRQSQNQLIDKNKKLDENYSGLLLPEIDANLIKLLPEKYIFFQFRYKFFNELNWSEEDIIIFLDFLKSKYEYVLFCSDYEDNETSNYFKNFFLNNFSYLDLNLNKKYQNSKYNGIYYLKDLSGVSMFNVIKKSTMCIAKEGIVSHICFFHKIKCHNLFNFKIKNTNDFIHQKISYSEWCKDMKFSFSFLDHNIKKALKKIKNQI